MLALAMGGAAGCKPDAAAPVAAAVAPAPSAAGAASPSAGAPKSVSPAGRGDGGRSEKDRARQVAAEAVPVEIATVARGPISAFLSFNSTLETESVVDLYPQINGQVDALYVEEGQVVKEGQPLLKIDDRELRVDVDESNGNYEHLKRGYARTQDLYARKLINKQDYETQTYQLEQARLRLERATIRLSHATIRAPFAGVVSARDTQVGARVGTGSKLFSLVKLDEIVARVFVPGRYLPVVAENQPAVVTSEFLPGRTFQSWVKRISPVIDPKSGTFKVTLGVRGDKPSELPPGMFVAVRVIIDTRESAILLPKRAVVYEGGERYVFVVANDRATKRKLAAGYEDPQNIEAVSGIPVGTEVIVLGHNGLKDGALIRVVNALTPIPESPEGAPKAGPAAPAPLARDNKS